MSGAGGIPDIRARLEVLEAGTGDPVAIADVTGLDAALAGKQSVLVSGETIKTVNGESLLGPGDIPISGGSAGLGGAGTVTPARGSYSHSETIAAVGVTGSSRVMVALGSFADTDENATELLDIAAMSATPGTDEITITMAFATPTSGPINIIWSAM
jgi:hypothetical protein